MATVTTEQELRDAIASSDPQISVVNDIALTLPNTVNYDLELTANGSVLSWNGASNAKMFSVVDGATFAIGNIVLSGAGSYVTIVSVQASTFVMNDGAVMHYILTVASVPAIAIGTSTDLSVGGTFQMNGGLITDVRSDNVIACWGGTITMGGNAAIAQNSSYGVHLQGGTLNMAENARISENVAGRTGTGVRATGNSVINMGLAEGDAPRISGNRSTNSYGGGVWLEGGSLLNMNYGASISGNTSTNFAGGVGLNNSTLNMNDNSAISGNTAQNNGGGGVYATAGSQVTMAGNSSIFDNQATGTTLGGGVYLQPQGATTTLTMRENASVYGNSANNGGGIYLGFGAVSLVIGVNATDTPSVTGNSARSNYGGIYIGGGATAALSAQSRIGGNTAGTNFNGLYTSGTLRISQNIQINDGLYFNSEAAAPVIVQALGENALIQLGSTSYISPDDIPLVVSVKGPDYEALTETDRAAFRAPADFPPGISAYLNADRDEVLLGPVMEIQGVSFTIKLIR